MFRLITNHGHNPEMEIIDSGKAVADQEKKDYIYK